MSNFIINDVVPAPPTVEAVGKIEQSAKVKAEVKKESQARSDTDSGGAKKENNLEEIISRTNKVASAYNNQISFEIAEQGDPPVVVIKNKESGEVIRQIPAEEMVNLNRKMRDLVGMMFNGRI